MTDTMVIQIAVQAITITAKLAGPILLTTLTVGFAISLIQSVTQIQEITLSFVPKLIGVAVVFLVAGHWMLSELTGFTVNLYDLIPRLTE